MAPRGENVTTYLGSDLKARAVAARVPFAFALSTIIAAVLAQLDGETPEDPVQTVLDEMARRAE
jgi:hypothetical protein